jgi:hypothetical protein
MNLDPGDWLFLARGVEAPLRWWDIDVEGYMLTITRWRGNTAAHDS